MCISKQHSPPPAEFRSNDLMEKSQPTNHYHPHIVVQHNYHDHSNEPKPAFDNFESLARSGANTAFPLKLYDMLQRVEEEGQSDIVSWQPHGRCFVVHKPEEFKDLLPRYFKLSKIASFQRQLNLYGFQRLTRGADRGGYYHELFLRGMPFLIQRMNRVKVKGTGVRARSNPDQEPDFWQMPVVGKNSTRTISPIVSPVSSKPITGYGSVVSNEDSAERAAEEAMVPDFEPLPWSCENQKIPSSTLPSSHRSHPQPRSEQQDDILLTGWGKPFHYLGSLDIPESSHPSTVTSVADPQVSSFYSPDLGNTLPIVPDDRTCSGDSELEDFLVALLE